MKRIARLALAGCLLFGPTSLVTAQTSDYPSRNIEIVVSYAPGGSTDLVARTLAERLQQRLGQSVIVLNKPGGGGTIGMQHVQRAKPDGHTLFLGFTAEAVITPQVSKAAKYSIVDDFEPIAVTGIVPVVLIGSKNLKSTNLKGLLAELKSNPGKYTYTGSVGSPSHVMGGWLNELKDLDVPHIPFRGGAQSVNAVLGAHADMFYAGVAPALSAIGSNGVKAYAVTGVKRSTALPDVPTFKEAGVPEFELLSWNVFLAPKGTPKAIVERLRKETLAALDEPKVQKVLLNSGVEMPHTQDVEAFLRRENDNYGKAIRAIGISTD